MRVLTVTNMYPEPQNPAWGTFIASQVESLVAQGVDTDVMIIRGYRSKLEYLRAIGEVRRRVREKDYDLVHAHYGLSGIVARMQTRVPVVISYCGNDLYGHANASGGTAISSMPLMWLQRFVGRFAARVIVKSPASAALVPGVSPEVVPNGVDMERFRPLPRAECREALGLDPEATYVLFPYATDRLRKNYPLFEATLDVLARRHGISARPLVVHGVPNERIPVYLNAADAMLLTSFWEGSPNAVKEAMACNTKVVSVDVGDVAQLFGDHPGYEVRGFDADALADALAGVLTMTVEPGIRTHIEWLSLEAIAARIIGIYDEAIALPRRR